MAIRPPLTIKIVQRRYAFGNSFAVGDNRRTYVDTIEVLLTRGGSVGRGECVPNPRYGESLSSVATQVSQLPADFDRSDLHALLRPGPARNAVDCALWDLEAKLQGKPAWVIAGLSIPRPLQTALTLSLDTPEDVERTARQNQHHKVMKIRISDVADIGHVEAMHRGAPSAKIILDAGESWTISDYVHLAPRLKKLNVVLIEQPLPAGRDAALAGVEHPIPVCADESCHDIGTLPRLNERYEAINIKLDKVGGLTHGLMLRDAALKAGMTIMVGSMIASSLAMAPAVLLAQGASFVDLDGPLLLAEDRNHGLNYEGGFVHPPKSALWG